LSIRGIDIFINCDFWIDEIGFGACGGRKKNRLRPYDARSYMGLIQYSAHLSAYPDKTLMQQGF